MTKRDNLFKHFRKSPTPTPPLQRPNESLVSNTSPPPVVESVVPVRPAINQALQIAIQKHLDELPEADKDAFRAEAERINQDGLLSGVKAYDDAHKSSSVFRPRSKDVSKFLSLLNRCLAGVGTAIQANPDPSSIVVGAVQLVVGLALQFVTFFDRLTEMLKCFDDYLEVLAEYSKASETSDLLQKVVVSIYGDFLKFCVNARHVFVDNNGVTRKLVSMRTFLRVQWDPFEAKFGEIEAKFKQHLNILQLSVGALQLNTLRSGMQEAEEERLRLKKKENTDQREAFLNWISNIDFETTHEDIYAKKEPGTSDWLTQTPAFQGWHKSGNSALLWCHGKPGIGKSVIMSNVLEHITAIYALSEKNGICFAYYNYRISELGDPCQIVSALVKQLCRKKETIPSDLLKFKQDSLQPSFASLQEIFISLATSFDQIFLIIDALDECPIDKRHQIIGFLTTIIKRVPLAKVFITSRKESDIEDEFKREETPIIEIKVENVSEDIKLYVGAEVRRLRVGYNGKNLYIKSDLLEEKVIEALVQKAEGMFLWVNLQLENLRSVSKARKDSLIESALERIPRGLNETYKRIIYQIDSQEEYMRALALKTFMWVLYAKRPLKVEELQDALATEEPLISRMNLEIDSIDVILEACGNLLIQEHDTIRPIHFSVQEFLSHPPLGAFQESCLKSIQIPALVPKKLAVTCMCYLELQDLHKGPCDDIFDLCNRLDENPLLGYATQYFDHHVRDLQDLPDEVLQLLHILLGKNGLFLAALLQARKGQSTSKVWTSQTFEKVTYSVNMSTILYSTKLFDIAVLNRQLVDLQIPTYALHNAAANGLLPAVSRLIEAGCDIEERDENQCTPLYFASLEGHLQVVELLLDTGAKVNMQGGNYGNALQAASYKGDVVVVRLLLEKGANVNAQGGFYGNALQAASLRGNEAIVELLLAKGADVNTQGGLYGNALQAASSGGNEAIVELLLVKGADVNAQGGYYGNALQAASSGGNEAIVELLLKSGADANALESDEEDDKEEDEDEEGGDGDKDTQSQRSFRL